MNYACALKKIRTSCDIQISEIAMKIGVTPQHLYRVEGGITRLSNDTIEKLCDFIGITFLEFHFLGAEKDDLPDGWEHLIKDLKKDVIIKCKSNRKEYLLKVMV